MKRAVDASRAQPCARCGAPLVCAGRQALAECWCAAYPHVLSIPGANATCLCRACLEQAIAAQQDHAIKDT